MPQLVSRSDLLHPPVLDKNWEQCVSDTGYLYHVVRREDLCSDSVIESGGAGSKPESVINTSLYLTHTNVRVGKSI
jgi:hypothetical protein